MSDIEKKEAIITYVELLSAIVKTSDVANYSFAYILSANIRNMIQAGFSAVVIYDKIEQLETLFFKNRNI